MNINGLARIRRIVMIRSQSKQIIIIKNERIFFKNKLF